jgi:hypothetical protein
MTPETREEALELLDRLRAILAEELAPAPAHEPLTAEAKESLTDADFADAADLLKCDVAAIRAVDEVESNGKGFGPDGRPIILFEPHVFSRLTGHRFDATHGGVSYLKWGAKPYKKTQAERWDQLLYAAKLDEAAAYKSASYGRYQILGLNHAACAFPTVREFVDAMRRSERDHLQAFCQFVLFNHLDDELRERRWEDFAKRYNGPGYAKNNYHGKMAAAFERLSRTP